MSLVQLNNGFFLKIVEWVFIVLFAVLSFFFSIKGTIDDVQELKPMVQQHDKTIAIIQNDITYIRQGVDEIKKAVK